MSTVLTACSVVRSCTAGVRIVKICLQFLLLVVLYGTVLQEQELLKCVYSSYCFSSCTYRIANAVSIANIHCANLKLNVVQKNA